MRIENTITRHGASRLRSLLRTDGTSTQRLLTRGHSVGLCYDHLAAQCNGPWLAPSPMLVVNDYIVEQS